MAGWVKVVWKINQTTKQHFFDKQLILSLEHMNSVSKVMILIITWTSEVTFFWTTSAYEIVVRLLAHQHDCLNQNIFFFDMYSKCSVARGEFNARVLNAFCKIKEFLAEGSEWRVGSCLHWTIFKLCLICSCELRHSGHLLTATKAAHQCSSLNYLNFLHQYQLFHRSGYFCLCDSSVLAT